MKILISGGTGFIGKRIIKDLVAKGHQVHVLSICKTSVVPDCEMFYWNAETYEFDPNCLNGVEALIHLAGASISGSWSNRGKEVIVTSRTETTAFLISKLRAYPNTIQYVVSASAIGIYEDIETIQTEDEFTKGDNFLADVVYKWEHAVDQFEQCGITVCKMRIGLVLDQREGALPLMANMMKYHLGSTMGSGRQYYSWIHIDDLVGCFVFAITNKIEGTYNAVAPSPVTNKEFMKGLALALKKKIWLPASPAWLLKLVLGEKSLLVLGGQNVSSKKIIKKGYSFKYLELAQAFEQIYRR